jgi:hypothetical protein
MLNTPARANLPPAPSPASLPASQQVSPSGSRQPTLLGTLSSAVGLNNPTPAQTLSEIQRVKQSINARVDTIKKEIVKDEMDSERLKKTDLPGLQTDLISYLKLKLTEMEKTTGDKTKQVQDLKGLLASFVDVFEGVNKHIQSV